MRAHDIIASLRPAILLLAIAGFVLGVVYFASLRHGVRISIARHAWLPYMLWAPARMAAAALFFAFAVHWGVPALLAAFVGFLAARQLIVRAARRLA